MIPFQIIKTNVSSRMAVIDLQSELLEERIIEINDEFNAETVSNWRNALLYLMSKYTPEETKSNPIKLYINSPGGEVYSMLGLYDTINLMKNKGYIISTTNVGLAASAAAFILMSGTKGYRYSLKNCRTMIHTISSGYCGKVFELINDVNEVKRVQEIVDNIIKENANESLITTCTYIDLWLSSQEAKDNNVIDEIL